MDKAHLLDMTLEEPLTARLIEERMSSQQPAWGGIARGTSDYRRVNLALFLAGFSTFSLLYCIQPLLPEFARDFGIDASSSALSLSLSTAALAAAILVAAAASQSVQRRGLMTVSLTISALISMAVAMAPNWPVLLALRLLCGLALGGVPAVALAYLAEEITREDLGKTVGLYIGGTAFGGVMGRLGMGFLTEFMSWRTALTVLGAIGLLTAFGFARLLPASRNFTPQPVRGLSHHLAIWRSQLRDRNLLRLFVTGFMLQSIYATTFNYIAFRLVAPPFSLGQAAMGALYLVAIFGIGASSVAGALADRIGKREPLIFGFLIAAVGIVVSMASFLPLVILGLGLINIGFFTSHSVATGWVGSVAGTQKGHAASLYMLFYYTGSTVIGVVGGWFWSRGAWPAVSGLLFTLVVLGLALSVSLRDRSRAI